MTAQAPAKTHCPNCGAKLHRPDLSLCAYCAMPLDIGATTPVDDETIQRLKRMREHANFPAAMTFTPRDPRVERKAARLLTYGSVAMALAIVLMIVSLIVWWRGLSPIIWAAVAILAAVVAAVLFVTAPALRRASDARPLLKRPALVVLRRSEMSADNQIHYFFTLRFDDGSEGEFQRPGLGTMYEPMANGYSGIAYSRGSELVDFRRLT
ncbi:MAG: hypothetical protein JNL28_12610 [Planctomycetes bacterium]|nr:hypothetical protein [Planctomycetota bacterium]